MSVDEPREVGYRIRRLRERAGWSREALAERLGVHAGSVARWESGGAVPHAYRLDRIAELGGVSGEWLRTGASPGGIEESAPRPEPEAEDLFGSLDAMVRFLGGIAPGGQEKLRKLDALEGLRRMLTARGMLPAWWYGLREKVEADEL
jgi:transcriptional regulator with XRE-family HTH domain